MIISNKSIKHFAEHPSATDQIRLRNDWANSVLRACIATSESRSPSIDLYVNGAWLFTVINTKLI